MEKKNKNKNETKRNQQKEIDTPTFPLSHSLFVERVKKSRSPGQSPLEESRKRPGLGERDSSKSSAHHGKIPHTGNARLHCF